ncbi:leucine-rich repeat-containing protein 15-like [Diorhabda sublineata]|uniref:leucine-rich repeat-containing protein 15-like n=1 Tax=Diorhabda sublineata TaxID=1163346 RepID=UPI0024E12E42|nr:leucine-rich repeat-containing protein 15-like [Diorhabda sublineata]
MIYFKIIKLSLILCVINEVNSFCENKDALNDITARLYKSKKSEGFRYIGSFYEMDKFEIIHVEKSNVTDLCEGMIKNFPKLEILSLINANISKIQANVFQKVSNLTELSLAVNKISEIVDGSFNNLEALQYLYLSGNRINSIGSRAFNGLPNLKKLYLDRNKLKQLDQNLLIENVLLKLVDLRYNEFELIATTTFSRLQLSHSEPITIYLGHNEIIDVDPTTFAFKNPINLHLESNKLNTISDLFHGINEYSVLYLNSNKFICLPDDVIENVKMSTKIVYLLDNPISCQCLRILDGSYIQEDGGSVKLIYDHNCTYERIVI